MTNNLVAAIRTGVASIVGAVITWLATKGITVDGAYVDIATIALFGVITGVYNVAVNWLQAKYGKTWGFLLGIPRLPAYDPASKEA